MAEWVPRHRRRHVGVDGDVEVGPLLEEDEGAPLVASEDGVGERRVAAPVDRLEVGATLLQGVNSIGNHHTYRLIVLVALCTTL